MVANSVHPNRESWYQAARVELENRVFKPAGYELPRIRIGTGWPTANKKKTGAQCFDSKSSKDKTYEIFVSPKFDKPFDILEMLVHELCHTIVGVKAQHKKPFIEVMQKVGMIKPWTACTSGPELAAILKAIGEKLGAYPHAELGLAIRGKKQTTRLLKVQCPECDYIARITRKWMDEVGGPLCPVHKVAFREVIAEEK